jgi:hypothetical protein
MQPGFFHEFMDAGRIREAVHVYERSIRTALTHPCACTIIAVKSA